MVKVTSSGKNEGDVEFTVQLDADASGGLTVGTLGGGLNGQLGFTATISLDAQNGYKPDKLVLKGNAGYTGSLDTNLLLEGDELKDISSALEEVSLSSSDRRRPGAGGLGRARPDRPGQPRGDAAGAHQPGPERAAARASASTRTASSASTPTTSTPPRPRARSRSAWASAAAVAAARAARPRATAAAWCACPAARSSRASASSLHDDARETTPIPAAPLPARRRHARLVRRRRQRLLRRPEGARRLQDLQHHRHLLRLSGRLAGRRAHGRRRRPRRRDHAAREGRDALRADPADDLAEGRRPLRQPRRPVPDRRDRRQQRQGRVRREGRRAGLQARPALDHRHPARPRHRPGRGPLGRPRPACARTTTSSSSPSPRPSATGRRSTPRPSSTPSGWRTDAPLRRPRARLAAAGGRLRARRRARGRRARAAARRDPGRDRRARADLAGDRAAGGRADGGRDGRRRLRDRAAHAAR